MQESPSNGIGQFHGRPPTPHADKLYFSIWQEELPTAAVTGIDGINRAVSSACLLLRTPFYIVNPEHCSPMIGRNERTASKWHFSNVLSTYVGIEKRLKQRLGAGTVDPDAFCAVDFLWRRYQILQKTSSVLEKERPLLTSQRKGFA
jgi:hypothetical protein